ncbi:hypothetical protein OOZ15_18640 [Galbibacter sp. EGI 63066]|uniref:MutS-related protein n=1 Tax=Galbibacter sp. EGI 63066 TaxID=2993559 RepID=UPI002248BDF6|nr:hypothetical protein [Galbibacter sp. EGI 63066]MCX2681976.1 hypothetical protein [Galbibacter sp. EGI 63066]
MAFVIDQQTLNDLNILGRYKRDSIFSFFSGTITEGGDRLLEKMFQHPFTKVEQINKRSSIISFFEKIRVSLPFDTQEFEVFENYLNTPAPRNRVTAGFAIIRGKLLNVIANDEAYVLIREDLEKTIAVLVRLKRFLQSIDQQAANIPYRDEVKRLLGILNNKKFKPVWECKEVRHLGFKQLLKLDYILRGLFYDQMEDLLQGVYAIDVYITVSNVARKNKYAYAKAVDKSEKYIDIKGVYHPAIANAVANDIYIGKDKNVFFLTGANMAGKSTLMKSVGVAVYLAHMGFPIAGKEMTFSVHDGIYTSINVPDNISKGYSHFYAEVLRVKHIAQEVASKKQLLVVFDELFKGTNVKDASEATISIIDAFSKNKGTFIVSTHIMEAGEALRKNNHSLFFKYLPTIVEGKVPAYTYQLEKGITNDRQGMMIIKNERILEIIKGSR